ncbi:hypothetical protein [Azospirillum endophyticum]
MPSAAGPRDVERHIQQSPHVRAERTPAALRQRKQRLDQVLPVIAESWPAP